jgi:hypothetical protein
MLEIIDFSVQEAGCHFPQTISEQDVSALLEVVNRADFDEFVKLIDRFDLDQVYDHEEFPEPQLLSRFLLLRFLGFISVEGDEHFPSGVPNAGEFIKTVLERKPDLTFCIDDGYSFVDFIKDRREVLVEAIADLHAYPERHTGYIPFDALLQSYEGELSQIELIANYLSL